MFSELGGVSVGEEVGLDLEIFHGQVASGTVIEEALLPLLKLMVGELPVFPQVLQHLRIQLAVLLAHGSWQWRLNLSLTISLACQATHEEIVLFSLPQKPVSSRLGLCADDSECGRCTRRPGHQ